jgi:hypothetical protein
MHPHGMHSLLGYQIYELDDAVDLALDCCFLFEVTPAVKGVIVPR